MEFCYRTTIERRDSILTTLTMLSSDVVNTSTTQESVSLLYHNCRGCSTISHPYSSFPVSFDLGANTDPAVKLWPIPKINRKLTISPLSLHHNNLLTPVMYQVIRYKSMRGLVFRFFVAPQNYTFQILIAWWCVNCIMLKYRTRRHIWHTWFLIRVS